RQPVLRGPLGPPARPVRPRRYSPGMVKVRSVFRCGECGGTSPKWTGRCPTCGEWNSLTEETDVAEAAPLRVAGAFRGARDTPVPIAEVDTTACAAVSTGIDELDRVLGGGLVP